MARDVTDDTLAKQFPSVGQENFGAEVQLSEVVAENLDEVLVFRRFLQPELREQLAQVAEGEEVLQPPERPHPRHFQARISQGKAQSCVGGGERV